MTKRILLIGCFVIFAISNLSLAQVRINDEPAPSRLPRVQNQMLTAGYWISKHPTPDQVIMAPKQIEDFNDNVRDNLKLNKDIFSLIGQFKTESLMDVFKKNIDSYTNKGYFTIDGNKDDSAFMDKVKANMHLSGVVLGAAPNYGVIVRFADQRFLPTPLGLYAKRGDVDFDEIQNSGLDIGTPVSIVHKSRDNKWVYVFSSLSDGWVPATSVATADINVVKSFAQPKDFIVITAPKADIFLDEEMTQFADHVRMGTKFPYMEDNGDQWIIQFPTKNKEGELELVKGYVAKSQANQGYLPYTARTIYSQAFEMLDKPYGWGDMYGKPDCSRFLQMIYATVGIELPRDSKNQAQVGEALIVFDEKTSIQQKLDSLKDALGGATILPLKGHIMLYLGMVDGVPFVIQETSGYGQTKQDLQIKLVLNRVVVSDLSLGEDSIKGSLLKRLSKIVEIK